MADGSYGPETTPPAALLQTHPAVAQALVADDPTSSELSVWIVPDRHAAPMLHRSVLIEQAGRLGALEWHEPGDGLRVAGLNRGETEFLYREIFTDDAYLRGGIDLPPGAVVIDVGANIGMFTLRAGLRSPGARIIAVEPVTELAAAVAINAELHGLDVTVVCAALADTEAETDFVFYPGNSVMSGLFAEAAEDASVLKNYLLTGDGSADTARLDRMVSGQLHPHKRQVPVTTLANIAANHAVDRIDLLKIDAEKAEWQVLCGVGDDLWPRIDRVALEVHDIDGRLATVVSFLKEKGFSVEVDQDPRLRLTPCHSVYAWCPAARPLPGPPAPAPAPARNGPSLNEVAHDLRRLIVRPARVVAVAALPELAAVGATAPTPTVTRRTEVLAEAWAIQFGPDAVRPDADYFELGGTSLLALRLLDHVEAALGDGALTVETIFAAGTFGRIAAALEAGEFGHETEVDV